VGGQTGNNSGNGGRTQVGGNAGQSGNRVGGQVGGNGSLGHNHSGANGGGGLNFNGSRNGQFGGSIRAGQYHGNHVHLGSSNVRIGGNNYRPSYYNHGFYNGHWNNSWNRGGWGRPIGWGLGGWGLGRIYYSSGYSNYYNPYYNYGYGGNQFFNYGQPFPVSMNNNSPSDEAEQLFTAAREAFMAADYPAALQNVDAAIQISQNDAVMHEFRGLTLFAMGSYQESAAVLHSILSVGPGWDWPTLRGLYPSLDLFTNQLRTLEARRDQTPERADLRFLLAYFYLAEGYNDAAASQLARVVAINPNDQLAKQLLSMLRPATPTAANPASPTPVNPPVTTPVNPPVAPDAEAGGTATPVDPAGPAVKPLDQAALVGDWQAERADSKFSLSMKGDGTFNWKFTEKEKTESFGGKYSVNGNLLVLERSEGGALVATITPESEMKFNFKIIGGDANDKGLVFTR